MTLYVERCAIKKLVLVDIALIAPVLRRTWSFLPSGDEMFVEERACVSSDECASVRGVRVFHAAPSAILI